MSKYLEAAAALVKKASDHNESAVHGAYDSKRVEYAKLYALLAAVDKGLMPDAVAEELYGQLRSGR